MLSFIYQLFRDYQLINEIRPNALFISHTHLAVLQTELETHPDPDKIQQYLGLKSSCAATFRTPKSAGFNQLPAKPAKTLNTYSDSGQLQSASSVWSAATLLNV